MQQLSIRADPSVVACQRLHTALLAALAASCERGGGHHVEPVGHLEAA